MLGSDPTPLSAADSARGGVGIAVQSEDPGLAQVGAQWYFNWDFRPHEDVDLEFVPHYLRQVIEAYEEQQGEPIPADYFAATNHVMKAAEIEVFESRVVEMRRLLDEHGLRDRGVILTEIGVPTRGPRRGRSRRS